jgi:hypothetical protein
MTTITPTAQSTLTVGDGVTLNYPQDAYGYVVTRVSASGKTAWVKPLRTVDLSTGHQPARYDGPFPVWTHRYTPEECESMVRADAPETKIVKSVHGGWVNRGSHFSAGGAVYHRNFSD